MSHEITNQAIELSADELDVVAGGASALTEAAFFKAQKSDLVSVLTNGPGGTTSLTATSDLDITSAAFKAVAVGF